MTSQSNLHNKAKTITNNLQDKENLSPKSSKPLKT